MWVYVSLLPLLLDYDASLCIVWRCCNDSTNTPFSFIYISVLLTDSLHCTCWCVVDRLTPLYMFLIMLFIYLVPFWGEGPLWTEYLSHHPHCRQYWWTNLLYINNFVPSHFTKVSICQFSAVTLSESEPFHLCSFSFAEKNTNELLLIN